MENEKLETQKESFAKLLNELIDKQVEFSRELTNIILQDTINAYENLIEHRKEATTKSIQLIDVLLKDETFDVTKTTQTLMDKQCSDIDKFTEELQILIDLQETLNNEPLDKDKANKLLEKL